MTIFKKEKKSILSNKKPILNKKEKTNLLQNTVKVTAGLLTGALAGLLFAPQAGKKTREKIKDNASDLGEQVSDKSKEIGKTTKEQVNSLKDKVKS